MQVAAAAPLLIVLIPVELAASVAAAMAQEIVMGNFLQQALPTQAVVVVVAPAKLIQVVEGPAVLES
jgi:hypothetical protein